MWCCALLALIPLAVITTYVVTKGYNALSVNFFTKAPAGPLDPTSGGIAQAFIGTAMIVGIATLISVPLGVLTAVYLAEYGKGRSAGAVRLIAEVLLSTPSIVAGAFIWSVVVVAMGSFSSLAGALALTVLMWPVIARATEEILRLVPQELRELPPLAVPVGEDDRLLPLPGELLGHPEDAPGVLHLDDVPANTQAGQR
jgi:phosphate transport system permease protein